MVAAATPKGAVVLADDDWSGISENAFGPAQFRKAGGATLVSAIESTEGDIALASLAVLLDKTRIEAHARDAARINGVDHRSGLYNGSTLMTLITTVELPPLAAATVH